MKWRYRIPLWLLILAVVLIGVRLALPWIVRDVVNARMADRDLGTWKAILNVLRNAFVEAYTPQLERLEPAPEDDAG